MSSNKSITLEDHLYRLYNLYNQLEKSFELMFSFEDERRNNYLKFNDLGVGLIPLIQTYIANRYNLKEIIKIAESKNYLSGIANTILYIKNPNLVKNKTIYGKYALSFIEVKTPKTLKNITFKGESSLNYVFIKSNYSVNNLIFEEKNCGNSLEIFGNDSFTNIDFLDDYSLNGVNIYGKNSFNNIKFVGEYSGTSIVAYVKTNNLNETLLEPPVYNIRDNKKRPSELEIIPLYERSNNWYKFQEKIKRNKKSIIKSINENDTNNIKSNIKLRNKKNR